MTDKAKTESQHFCWSCRAEIADGARFCSACGAPVWASAPRAQQRKRGRLHGAIMFLAGAGILLFAGIHRNPADIILVIAFGLPLCGAGALIWKMA